MFWTWDGRFSFVLRDIFVPRNDSRMAMSKEGVRSVGDSRSIGMWMAWSRSFS